MSGIVGIINLDGASVSSQLLRRMTEFMSFRGPDAQEIWIEGETGLGHAMLRTTDESFHERQPRSLDGRVWIVADARIDGRADLIRQLEGAGSHAPKNAADTELILRSYHVWGDGCVDHLLGDFAFAIWDGQKKRLFCARDHFGVKPFFYARTSNCLVIGNSLDCIRMHPAISDGLNEQAIGDFLLFGSNEEPDTTFFADVRRLPAAHTLTWSEGDLKVRRYWTLPIHDEIRYKRDGDYIERFVELLDEAVEDRLRTDRVGIFMSGGMDSPTIAATAHKVLSKNSTPFHLSAFTVVYDRLIPDQERYYSGLVAEKLGIPIHYLVADDYKPYERWDQPELRQPEPCHAPLAVINADQYRQAAAYGRVMLTGEGGDVVLRPSFSHLLNLLKDLKPGYVVTDLGRYILKHRRLPRIGFRTRLKKWLGKPVWEPAYPSWLNPDFESRLNLKERWKRLYTEPPLIHPRRPEAYKLLTSLFWANLFEEYDPDYTRFPIETRHPLFDVRLVNYLLALPSLPWGVDKELMRVTMAGRLPEQTLRRRKAPLAGNPLLELLRRQDNIWPEELNLAPILSSYIRWESLSQTSNGGRDGDQLWIDLQPLSLNYWLQPPLSTHNNFTHKQEVKNGITESAPC